MVTYETECAHCRGPLTGRQRRACSDACRKALQRRSPALRTCRLCNQPFKPSGRGQRTVCPYEDADTYCQGLQDNAEDAEAMRQALRQAATCEGPGCSAPLYHAGPGRPRKYCSRTCRNRGYKAQAKGQTS